MQYAFEHAKGPGISAYTGAEFQGYLLNGVQEIQGFLDRFHEGRSANGSAAVPGIDGQGTGKNDAWQKALTLQRNSGIVYGCSINHCGRWLHRFDLCLYCRSPEALGCFISRRMWHWHTGSLRDRNDYRLAARQAVWTKVIVIIPDPEMPILRC